MIRSKKYKALMMDLDGTTISHDLEGMPSEKVRDAIRKGREKLFIGIATGRPYYNAKHILEFLELTGPSIFNNGAQVRDTVTGEILAEQTISYDDLLAVYEATQKLKLDLLINTRDRRISIEEAKQFQEQLLGAWVMPIPVKTVNILVDQLSHISTLAITTTPTETKDDFYVVVSHASATKQHGILEVAKILGIDTHDIIGVGDGDNDFPLLMACGLRVAMGNAVDGLKDIADYVAPSVFEDGVADVIQKFVLKDS